MDRGIERDFFPGQFSASASQVFILQETHYLVTALNYLLYSRALRLNFEF